MAKSFSPATRARHFIVTWLLLLLVHLEMEVRKMLILSMLAVLRYEGVIKCL